MFKDSLNLDATIAKDLFKDCDYPCELLPTIKEFILNLIPNLGDEYEEFDENVYVHKDAKVAKSACIVGPTIICKGAEIRHCAYIRGSVIVGENSVIGNSTEVKNAIIFNNCQCPHYNYVGDSVLGEYAHTGAGVILSNVKSDKKNVKIKINGEVIETGLRKFGSIICDHVEVGCNSVLNPGTVIGQHTNIYPLSMVRGYVPAKSIYKKRGEVVEKR